MRKVSYVVKGADGATFETVKYGEATAEGCKIVETRLTNVEDPEDKKAVEEQVAFWRKYRK